MTHEHPGQIVFVDETAGTERTRPVAEVPESIAWAEVDGERIPVTRVVARVAKTQRVIRSYGADGELLSSTVQVPRR
jgi:hypothetical protein